MYYYSKFYSRNGRLFLTYIHIPFIQYFLYLKSIKVKLFECQKIHLFMQLYVVYNIGKISCTYFRLFITFTELVTKTTHYMTKKIQNSFQFDFFLIISFFSVFSSLLSFLSLPLFRAIVIFATYGHNRQLKKLILQLKSVYCYLNNHYKNFTFNIFLY